MKVICRRRKAQKEATPRLRESIRAQKIVTGVDALAWGKRNWGRQSLRIISRSVNSLGELARSGRVPKTYATLVALHAPRPLKDAISYDTAMEISELLACRRLNADQNDYLEILGMLLEAYEDRHVPALPKPSGLDFLQFLLDQNRMTRDDLAALLNIEPADAGKILTGTRSLTVEQVHRLAARFAVTAELFIGEGKENKTHAKSGCSRKRPCSRNRERI